MTKPHVARRTFGARLADPRLWLGLVSASLVGWFALRAAREAPGPGPLSRVHAAQPELRGASGCVACHGALALGDDAEAAMQAACVACHAPIGAQLAEARGLHGALPRGGDCARCHGEHHGPAFEPNSPATFALAGLGPLEAYDHRGLDFALLGAHATLACEACHPNAEARGAPLASGRFLGLSQACTACHEDPHDGRFGANCAECHGQERPFAEAARFVHTAAFALNGAHAGHACASCHAPESAYALEAYGSEPAALRACADCHASPHGVAFVEAPGSTCAACHAPAPRGFERADEGASRAVHAATGFALAEAHAAVTCEACHDPALPFATRYPGRTADACATCHADPHGGQFGDPARDPALCARCHETTTFAAHTFDAAAHAAADAAHTWPLTGAHTDLACNACHTPAEGGGARVYRGTPRTCASCHADAHAGAFERVEDEASAGCARCHDTRSFRGASERFEHARWTGYPLEGAHSALDCRACHLPPPDGGRRLGPVEAAFLPGATRAELAACSACHADPHAGRFTRVGLPEVVDGRAGCARCHEADAFSDVPPTRFDHGAWTGFALEGAHRETRCVACHGIGAAAAESSTSAPTAVRRLGVVADLFPGPTERCATCHADPHGARFDAHAPESVAGAVGCARCHGTATFHRAPTFEHAWTGFALTGRHAEVACAACHAPTAPDAHGRTRGAAHGTSCADCHADPHGGQFVALGVNDCARCHAADTTFAALEFDHARDTRFALDATHAPLACAACHRPARTRDGRELVRYRPLGTSCADCHGTTGGGR